MTCPDGRPCAELTYLLAALEHVADTPNPAAAHTHLRTYRAVFITHPPCPVCGRRVGLDPWPHQGFLCGHCDLAPDVPTPEQS
jgi:hypothetical protein